MTKGRPNTHSADNAANVGPHDVGVSVSLGEVRQKILEKLPRPAVFDIALAAIALCRKHLSAPVKDLRQHLGSDRAWTVQPNCIQHLQRLFVLTLPQRQSREKDSATRL